MVTSYVDSFNRNSGLDMKRKDTLFKNINEEQC